MNTNDVLIYHGAFSAAIFSIALVLSKENQIANKFLALLIIALGYNLIHSKLLNEGAFNEHPSLHLLPYFISFGVGPILFLYVQSLCTTTSPKSTHLLWLLADYPHSLYHLIVGRGIDNSIVHEISDKFGFLSIILTAYYLKKSYHIITKYHKELPTKLSNLEYQRLRWLNQLGGIFLISIPIAIVFWILLVSIGIDFNSRTPIYFLHILTIFWLGIGGIKQHEIVARVVNHTKVDSREQPAVHSAHLKTLLTSMEHDKLYLLPDLNVRYLEDRLGLTAKQISEALNQELNKNFYTFINEYRVAEFKRKAKSEQNLTLVGIAMKCGFNSKATFQRVFKELTGQRPADFVKQVKN